MKSFLILSTLALVVVGIWLHEPIPRHFSSPWKLRLRLAGFKVVNTICRTLDTLHINPYHGSIEVFQNLRRKPLDPELLDAVDTQEAEFDGINVIVYRPKLTQCIDCGKGLIYIHGGGWITGSASSHKTFLSRLAATQHIVSISVSYRLAPEYPFPVPFEDCVVAAKYFLQHAADFGVDPTRVGITGSSAGGNLAAAVALKLRDEKFPFQPKLQLLVYPVLQAVDFQLPSYQQNWKGPLLTAEYMSWGWSQYITGHGHYRLDFLNNSHTTPTIKRFIQKTSLNHQALPMEYHYAPYRKPSLDHGDKEIWNQVKETLFNPYLAPLMAKDLSDLPTAYIMTAQYDILRDEGILYGQRLKSAGVAVTHHNLPKGFHGVMDMPRGSFPETDEAYDLYETFIKDNL